MKYLTIAFFAVMLCSADILSAVQINKDYITGEWCFDSIEISGEHESEKRNYLFRQNGELLYQNSRHSDKMKKGMWGIVGDKLRIKPEFLNDLEIISASDDILVLKFFGKLNFERGTCEQG